MFSRQVSDQIELKLAIPYFAPVLFELTDANRSFLRRWLPWLDATTKVDHTREFLEHSMREFAKGTSLNVCVFFAGAPVGMAGFNQIDSINQCGQIGYWLAESYNGRGIMTRVVSDLIDLGKQYYALRRLEIRCASENERSRAIPCRLGFHHEGTLRQAQKLYDRWIDLEIHSFSTVGDTKQSVGK